MGKRQGLASVIVKEDIITGWKSRIFGYMSKGDSVPDVITTVWNRLKTGLIAIDESRQLQQKKDSIIIPVHEKSEIYQLFKINS